MIIFASNATGWHYTKQRMIPGGMTDACISPIIEHLRKGSYRVSRQPHNKAVNVYTATRNRYRFGNREIGKVGVQISHGIADKSYRIGDKMRTFDYVTSSGPLYTERFMSSGVPEKKIIELGYPKLDPIFRGLIKEPKRDDRIRVVYAPTHGGGSEIYMKGNRQAPGGGATSWWHSDEIISLFDPDEFDVVFAPHPRHRKDKRSTLQEYLGADVVIADGGSTIYESWILDLPVVFPSWITSERNLEREQGKTLEAYIYRNRIGYHTFSEGELVEAVREASQHGITDDEQTFAKGILPDEFRGTSGKRYADFLMSL